MYIVHGDLAYIFGNKVKNDGTRYDKEVLAETSVGFSMSIWRNIYDECNNKSYCGRPNKYMV